jgi:hypothetical protein
MTRFNPSDIRFARRILRAWWRAAEKQSKPGLALAFKAAAIVTHDRILTNRR